MRSIVESPVGAWGRAVAAVALALTATAAHAQSADQNCPPPAPEDVVAVALRRSGPTELDADALVRRSRRSAWLPESARVELRTAEDDYLRSESRLDQDFDELFVVDGVDLTDLDRTGTSSLREARLVLVWDLSRLAWSDRELAIERAARETRSERTRLVERVLELYFDWLAARTAPIDAPARRGQDEAELRARLDALTAGWFSRAATCQPPPAEPP